MARVCPLLQNQAKYAPSTKKSSACKDVGDSGAPNNTPIQPKTKPPTKTTPNNNKLSYSQHAILRRKLGAARDGVERWDKAGMRFKQNGFNPSERGALLWRRYGADSAVGWLEIDSGSGGAAEAGAALGATESTGV